MKLLWLCNRVPGAVQDKITGETGHSGLWMDHVLSDLRKQELTLHILAPGGEDRGALDDKCSYATFSAGLAHEYLPQQENWFEKELREYHPDVIHVWGTEFAHTLAMVNAAERVGLLDHLVVSIQGLCSIYTGHYAEGVPHSVQRGSTFRDLVRRDNICLQQEKFRLRGELERKALAKVRHVIGRTDWDKACTQQLSPKAQYHFCNETLREEFYEGQWNYAHCQKHRVFASSCVYPVKGFHYLLEAFAEVVKVYPDATLAVPGKSFLVDSAKEKLRQSGYQKYLAGLVRQYGLEEKIQFLGSLTAAEMKKAFLEANVFALPSTIENSPNSLGEAMLLGLPCVAADVGGVTTMMSHGEEGYVYQSTAPYMLAHYIMQSFAMRDQAAVFGEKARQHAGVTHNPEKNLTDLLSIYRELSK